MSRQQFKDVEISGRKFRIKKFNAMTGSFMLLKVIGILTPLFKGVDIKKFKDAKSLEDLNIDFAEALSGLTSLPEKDFNDIQVKCLNICFEDLPGGLTPVLNDNGTFGVIGLEDDTMTVMALTVHVLLFNMMGFFPGNLSSFPLEGILNTFQQNAKT